MSLLPFLATALLLAITPGPGIAYVVARTVAGGRSEGLASCLGTGLGGMVHVLAAAFGLSLLVAQSAFAFSNPVRPPRLAPATPLVPQLVMLGSICVAVNTLVDVVAVFAAARLLQSDLARAARARLLTRLSAFTMIGLGAWLALARRSA